MIKYLPCSFTLHLILLKNFKTLKYGFISSLGLIPLTICPEWLLLNAIKCLFFINIDLQVQQSPKNKSTFTELEDKCL